MVQSRPTSVISDAQTNIRF